jgi:hypothetical protein
MLVAAPFVWRCLSGSAITPFPHPAHRTHQADFPHNPFAPHHVSMTLLQVSAWRSMTSLLMSHRTPGLPVDVAFGSWSCKKHAARAAVSRPRRITANAGFIVSGDSLSPTAYVRIAAIRRPGPMMLMPARRRPRRRRTLAVPPLQISRLVQPVAACRGRSLPRLNRHSPDSARFRARITPLAGLSKASGLRCGQKGDRSWRSAAPQR